MNVSPFAIFGLILVLYLISSIKILNEYERGVIFRLGKLLPHSKGPGVILVFAPIDRSSEPSHDRDGRTAARRHHAGQRFTEGQCSCLFPGDGTWSCDCRS